MAAGLAVFVAMIAALVLIGAILAVFVRNHFKIVAPVLAMSMARPYRALLIHVAL